MSFARKMNSSKIVFIIALIALMMLFVFPIQSMSINDGSLKLPTRHKRWTFNTWRLHGRRQLSNGLIYIFIKKKYLFFLFLDLYFPKTSNVDHQYDMFNNENDVARKIHEPLSKFFQELNHE
jgi:hypothetical protein